MHTCMLYCVVRKGKEDGNREFERQGGFLFKSSKGERRVVWQLDGLESRKQ